MHIRKCECFFGKYWMRPSKLARLVIGAMIIKHKLNLSDEETVMQIQENPYLQYFCGYETYIDAVPFVPSLFVEIRKRMGADTFASFEQSIVDQAVSIQKSKQGARKSKSDQQDPSAPPLENGPDAVAENESPEAPHQGRLLMDATVADQMIRFPTDLGLLNQAREIAEEVIDALHKHKKIEGKKPRTYRQQARKAYLGISKRKRPGNKLIRKGILCVARPVNQCNLVPRSA